IEDRDETPRDRRRARAAIGLDDVTINPHGALTQNLEIHHGSQRTANQPLDLMGASTDAAACHFSGGPCAGGAWQHGVFGSQPPLSGATPKWRHPLLNTRCTNDLCIPDLDEDRPFGMLIKVARDQDRPQLIGLPPISSHTPLLRSP